MKKLVMLIVATCMTVALTACGEDNTRQQRGTGTDRSVSQPQDTQQDQTTRPAGTTGTTTNQ